MGLGKLLGHLEPPRRHTRTIFSGWLAAVILGGCSVAPPPPSTPSASGSPRPSQSSEPAGPSAPPAEFDPADLLWVGDGLSGTSAGNYDSGVWVGTADGSIRRVTAIPGDEGTSAAGRLFYMAGAPPENGYESLLWMVESTGEPQLLGSGIHRYAVASGAGAVVIARATGDGSDAGVWLVPFSGADPQPVIPGGSTQRRGTAATVDGRRIASGRCSDGLPPTGMQLAEGGRVSDLGVAGIPLGFDAEGRLVFWDGCRPGGLSRVDGAGKGELLVDGAAEARVTPSGRYTIALSRNPADLSDHEIRVVDLLGDGDWSFRLEGDWRLTRLGDDRYGVLEGAASGTPAELQMLVVSLEGRWVGALPTPASPQPSR